MENKTCEEYVLAELEKAQEEVERLKELVNQYKNSASVLKMLQEIFVVEDTDPNQPGLNIGVREELLDITKDNVALSRVILLRELFGQKKTAEATEAAKAEDKTTESDKGKSSATLGGLPREAIQEITEDGTLVLNSEVALEDDGCCCGGQCKCGKHDKH